MWRGWGASLQSTLKTVILSRLECPEVTTPKAFRVHLVQWKLLELCPTLCNPMDSSPPGSSVHGLSRQEYWSGLPFPSPWPRYCISGRFSIIWASELKVCLNDSALGKMNNLWRAGLQALTLGSFKSGHIGPRIQEVPDDLCAYKAPAIQSCGWFPLGRFWGEKGLSLMRLVSLPMSSASPFSPTAS